MVKNYGKILNLDRSNHLNEYFTLRTKNPKLVTLVLDHLNRVRK